MSRKLKADSQIRKLAYDLGLKPKDNIVEMILEFCVNRIRSFVKECPCATLSDLVEVVAVYLDTVIVEIRTDQDLHQLRNEMMAKGETGFAQIIEDFASLEFFAITIRRLEPESTDRKFISVIDCRGEKGFRSYFSKWHELAHLLTLTDQLRLSFCRTHAVPSLKDPEEALMDVIAGEIGFFPDIIAPHVTDEISFDSIDLLRGKLCPEASFQSSVISFAHSWPKPCILVQVDLGLKKKAERSLHQYAFEFVEEPVRELRAVRVHSNPAAASAGIFIYENMRVPSVSVIHKVFSDSLQEAAAEEDLDWWETSNGERLESCFVKVFVRRLSGKVYALVVPK